MLRATSSWPTRATIVSARLCSTRRDGCKALKALDSRRWLVQCGRQARAKLRALTSAGPLDIPTAGMLDRAQQKKRPRIAPRPLCGGTRRLRLRFRVSIERSPSCLWPFPGRLSGARTCPESTFRPPLASYLWPVSEPSRHISSPTKVRLSGDVIFSHPADGSLLGRQNAVFAIYLRSLGLMEGMQPDREPIGWRGER